jgi:hypothetical protein
MEDLYSIFQSYRVGCQDDWNAEWLDEVKRRNDWDKSGLSQAEEEQIAMLRFEKENGVSWKCSKCYGSYLVKTPFNKLYCPNCLSRLKGTRLLPKGKVGYWIFDDVGPVRNNGAIPEMDTPGSRVSPEIFRYTL